MSEPLQKPYGNHEEDAPSSSPQVVPIKPGQGHPDYHFVQGLMALQQSMVRVETVLESVKKSSDETKEKVAKVEKILYAASVIMVICIVAGGWLLSTAKDFAMTYFKATVEAQAKQSNEPPRAPSVRPKQ